MLTIDYNKDNHKYTMINIKDLEEYINNYNNSDEYNIPNKVIKELNKIKEVCKNIKDKDFNYDIALYKLNPILIFLNSQTYDDNIFDKREYVSKKDIENAYKIAKYTNNDIKDNLELLVKQDEEGYINVLKEKYGNSMDFEYIKNNSNYNDFIKQEKGTYKAKKYYAYEIGEIEKRVLYNEEKTHNCRKIGEYYG